MRGIHVIFDDQLLGKLDDEEMKRQGCSAVIRHAVADHLRKQRRATIADAKLSLNAGVVYVS